MFFEFICWNFQILEIFLAALPVYTANVNFPSCMAYLCLDSQQREKDFLPLLFKMEGLPSASCPVSESQKIQGLECHIQRIWWSRATTTTTTSQDLLPLWWHYKLFAKPWLLLQPLATKKSEKSWTLCMLNHGGPLVISGGALLFLLWGIQGGIIKCKEI